MPESNKSNDGRIIVSTPLDVLPIVIAIFVTIWDIGQGTGGYIAFFIWSGAWLLPLFAWKSGTTSSPSVPSTKGGEGK
jgi:hypothetical protein